MHPDPLHTTRSLKFRNASLLCALLIGAFAEASMAGAGSTNVSIGYCTGDLAAAKAAGFDYVEIRVREVAGLSDADFAALVDRYRTAGLPTPTGNVFLPAELKVVGPDVHTNDVMSYIRKALDRCQKLGVRIIVFGSGEARRAPEGFSREQALQQLIDLAKVIAPEAAKRDIVIVVEPLRRAESNTINTAAEGLRWVEAVNHPNFQLLVDIYHLTEEREDPAIIVQAGSRLRHIHLSNPRGRIFPLPADGFDYAPFMKALNQINYRGRLSIEARTDNLSVDGPKCIEFVRATYAHAGVQNVRGE